MSDAETSTDVWDDVSYVVSSKYRLSTMRRLEHSPATPSKIEEDTDPSVSHISRALQELAEEDLVELLVSEDRRKGRIYGLTDHGEEVAERMEVMDR